MTCFFGQIWPHPRSCRRGGTVGIGIHRQLPMWFCSVSSATALICQRCDDLLTSRDQPKGVGRSSRSQGTGIDQSVVCFGCVMKHLSRHISAVMIVGTFFVLATPLAAKTELAAKQSKLHKSRTVITFYNGRGRWALFSRYDKCWQVPSPHKHLCHVSRENLTWHGARARRLEHEIYRLQHPVPQIGHEQGWRCITNGAHPGSPGDPHEGNGYNGSYAGPLGMTTPWSGHYPPGGDWVHSSVSAVYAIAEREAAKHRWSYSWMQGQWPRTFPPCAHYF